VEQASTCTDSGNILNLNQQYASATGAVLSIQNAGTGPDIQLGNGIIRPTSDSATAIRIQNVAGTGNNVFTADTTNRRIGINLAGAPSYNLDVGGDANITGVYRVNGTQIASSNLSDGSNLAKLNAANVFTANNTFNATGATTFTSSATSGNAVLIQGNSETTGTALALTANALTTGTGLSVSTTSASLTSANLAVLSQASTYAAPTTVSGSTLSASRSLTSSIGVITKDGSTSTTSGGGGVASLTYAYNAPNTNNRVLVVTVQVHGVCGLLSATYNNVSMTSAVTGSDANFNRVQIFYLVNPVSGSHNVVITPALSCPLTSSASSWSNVDQTTPIAHTATPTSGTSTTPSINFTTNSGEMVIDSLVGNITTAPVVGGSQTAIQSTTNSSMGVAASYKTASAGSTTMGWTIQNTDWVQAAISLSPVNVSITGAAVNVSSNCTQSGGACTDSSNILNLNQQYASATGAVLSIQNAGSGAAIALTQTGSSTVDVQLAQGTIQSAAGTTSTGVKLQSGAASAGSSGTAQLLTGSGTTGTGAITIQTGTSTTSGGTSGNITIDAGGTNTGTPGSISIGTTNANAVSIGRTGQTTTINGALTVTQASTFNGGLTVAGTTGTFQTLTLSQAHFKSTQTNAPTIGTPTNCGTSPPPASVTAGSTDSAGSFTITTGTGGGYTSCDTVFTFNKPYGAAPKSILITPTSSAAASARQVYVSASSATTFTVKFGTNPVADGEADSFNYWVIE
jgi:hypothetical protein